MTDATPIHSRDRSNWITFVVILVGIVAIIAWQFRPRGSAPDTVGWRHDYDAGLAEAAQTGKPAFVLFTAQWCPPCQTMAHDVFPQETVTTLIRDRVIPIKVDLTTSDGPGETIANRFEVQGIPTMLLIDPASGQVLARQEGGLSANTFTQWLAAALDALAGKA